MKKLFTFLLAAVAAMTVSAQTSKVLFEDANAPMLKWSALCSVSADDVKDIKAGDEFVFTVKERDANNQWPKFGFEYVGGGDYYPSSLEMWGDKTFPMEAKYIVLKSDVENLKKGFDIKGDGVVITKIVLVSNEATETPDNETIVFNNPDAPMLSWSVACEVTAAQVEGIKAGDAFVVTVAERNAATEWPKFGFEYKGGGDNYPEPYQMWGDKTFPMEATYIISAEDAEKLKDGFSVKGDGVRLTKIVYVQNETIELPEGQSMLYNNPDAPMLSWAVACSVSAEQVEGIKVGDSFIFTVNARNEACDWPKFGFVKGAYENYPEDLQMWGEKTFPMDVTYYVTKDDVDNLKDGFDVKGDGVQITRVIFDTNSAAGNAEQVLWSGDATLLSWGAGPTVPEGKTSNIEAKDTLAITVTELVSASNVWPKVVCRSENGWDEIFTVELFGDAYKDIEVPFVTEVEVTETMLPLLKSGFNFGGEGAYINKVVLKKNPINTGVENVVVDNAPAVVSVYSFSGVCVRHNVDAATATEGLPAGLYIVGGKKVLVK